MVEKEKPIRLAGVVILYNPEADVSENVASYIDSIDRLFIVDNHNGEDIANRIAQTNPNKVEILTNKENEGIAKPLNRVLELCRKEGFDLLLTMDQDSRFLPGHMDAYRKEIEMYDWTKTFGLGPTAVAREVCEKSSPSVPQQRLRWKAVYRLITSGNVVSVKVASEISGYNEDLFIDEVDFEICYRALEAGYLLFQTSDILFGHRLGNPLTKRFIWRDIQAMNHPPIRKYYIVRNQLVVWRRFHRIDEVFFFSHYILVCVLDFFKIFYMEPNKLKKANFYLMGIIDALRGRMGKRW